jgi:hypothetical protein
VRQAEIFTLFTDTRFRDNPECSQRSFTAAQIPESKTVSTAIVSGLLYPGISIYAEEN